MRRHHYDVQPCDSVAFYFVVKSYSARFFLYQRACRQSPSCGSRLDTASWTAA